MAGNAISDDQILHRGEIILNNFIQEELNSSGTEVTLEEQPALSEEEEEARKLQEIALQVRRTAQKLQRDTELNHVIDSKWPVTSKDSYWKLVCKVFEDGVISWERIVVLFYIAGKVSVKLASACVPHRISDIISWTLDFLRRNLLAWIREHGGWENIVAALNTHSSQKVVVFIVGILLGGFIVWRMKKRN